MNNEYAYTEVDLCITQAEDFSHLFFKPQTCSSLSQTFALSLAYKKYSVIFKTNIHLKLLHSIIVLYQIIFLN